MIPKTPAESRSSDRGAESQDLVVTGADLKRASIVAHAAELFDRSGYGNTSMTDIANAVNIAKPTLYHYFRSKEEILYSIHEEFITILLKRQEDRAGTGLNAKELLLEFIADIIGLMDTHRGHVRVFFEHHRELSADAQKLIRHKRDEFRERLVAILEQGVDDGDFREIDVRLAAWAVLGMANWTYQWYVQTGTYTARQVAQQFFGFISQGIGIYGGPELARHPTPSRPAGSRS
jgi:AcrR family transcriptional regulator